MEFGIMTEPQMGGTYDDSLVLARWAEGIGLDVIARSDHYLNNEQSKPATDAFTALGGLARETSTIQLCVLVSPITFRHPGVIAKAAATVDHMSGGRMALGVGTGWMEAEHDAFGLALPPMGERFDRLYEALAYLRSAFGKDPGGYQGRYYSIADIDVLPAPTGSLPIIVGGSGPRRTPSLAGRFADEYNTMAAPLEDLAARISVVREAERSAGREPGAVRTSVMAAAFVAPTDKEFADLVEREAAGRNMTADDLRERLESRGYPMGTPDRAAETIAAWSDIGVDRYYLQVFEPLDAFDTKELEATFAALRG